MPPQSDKETEEATSYEDVLPWIPKRECKAGVPSCRKSCGHVKEEYEPPRICSCILKDKTKKIPLSCREECSQSYSDYKTVCHDAHEEDVDELTPFSETCHYKTIQECKEKCRGLSKHLLAIPDAQICACFDSAVEEMEKCNSFCTSENGTQYSKVCKGSVTLNCGMENTTLDTCTAACTQWKDGEEPICTCTRQEGRSPQCLKEGNVCDRKDEQETFKKYKPVCSTIDSIHDVHHVCREQKYEDCEKVCMKYEAEHKEELKYVPECKCTLETDSCSSLCQNETKDDELRESQFCTRINNIDLVDKGCTNVRYDNCKNACSDKKDTPLCTCFANVNSTTCLAACNESKYLKICEVIRYVQEVNKSCNKPATTNMDHIVICNNTCIKNHFPKEYEAKPKVCGCTEAGGLHKSNCNNFCNDHNNAMDFKSICDENKKKRINVSFIIKDRNVTWKYIENANISLTLQPPIIDENRTEIVSKKYGKADVSLYIGTKYNILVKHTDYQDENVKDVLEVKDGSSSNVEIYMTTKYPGDGFSISLIWEKLPRDLDLHVLTYDKKDGRTPICHTFYDQKGEDGGGCQRTLMKYINSDIAYDKNPEVILAEEPLHHDVYFIYAYNFRGFDKDHYSLVKSKAEVTIKGNRSKTQTKLKVPMKENGPYRTWQIGCIDGSLGYSSFEFLNKPTEENPITNNKPEDDEDEYQKCNETLLQETIKKNNEHCVLRQLEDGKYNPQNDYFLKLVIPCPCKQLCNYTKDSDKDKNHKKEKRNVLMEQWRNKKIVVKQRVESYTRRV